MRRLAGYDWPGNVRELENMIERAAILARDGRLRIELPDSARPAMVEVEDTSALLPALLTDADRRDRDRANITAALQSCGGRIFGPHGAAALLGVKPTTLASRIKVLGIDKASLAETAGR